MDILIKSNYDDTMNTIYEQLVAKIAKRWIAGVELDDAIMACKEANSIGLHGIINYLGEDILDRNIVKGAVKEYKSILDAIEEERLDCSISIKSTQIGLAIDEVECKNNLKEVLEYASSYKKFIWIDMESSTYLEKIIDMYIEVRRSYENVGIALQSYIRDAPIYLAQLLDANAIIRLTKGAYREDASIIFKSKDMIDRNYIKLMEFLFKNSNDNFAIATHDSKIIELAENLSNIYRCKFEFQMLRGIRDDLKKILVGKGYAVGEYIPYGGKALEYSIRRIKEHPTNIFLLIRSIV